MQTEVETKISQFIVWRKVAAPGQAIGNGTGKGDAALPNLIQVYRISRPEPGGSNQLMMQIDHKTQFSIKSQLSRPIFLFNKIEAFDIFKVFCTVRHQATLLKHFDRLWEVDGANKEVKITHATHAEGFIEGILENGAFEGDDIQICLVQPLQERSKLSFEPGAVHY